MQFKPQTRQTTFRPKRHHRAFRRDVSVPYAVSSPVSRAQRVVLDTARWNVKRLTEKPGAWNTPPDRISFIYYINLI